MKDTRALSWSLQYHYKLKKTRKIWKLYNQPVSNRVFPAGFKDLRQFRENVCNFTSLSRSIHGALFFKLTILFTVNTNFLHVFGCPRFLMLHLCFILCSLATIFSEHSLPPSSMPTIPSHFIRLCYLIQDFLSFTSPSPMISASQSSKLPPYFLINTTCQLHTRVSV